MHGTQAVRSGVRRRYSLPWDSAPHAAASRLRAARSASPVARSPSTPPGLELPSTAPGTMFPSPYVRSTPRAGPRQACQRPPRNRGSSTSRSASPSMLNPNTASEIATPGHTAIHGARNMYVRPEPDNIAPHDGYGGGTPKPRNDSADSARMTAPSPIVARMMMVATTFGSRWRTMMRA